MPSAEMPVCEFLNVDLELYPGDGFEQFLNYIEPAMTVLHQSPKLISLELNNFPKETPEATILAFVSLIESLPPKARKMWKRFDRRSFDVGVQAGVKPQSTCFTISSKTIAVLAGLEAEIVFTVYAPPETASAAPIIAEVGR